MNFIEFEKKFLSEREVIDCFLNNRYPGGVKCNFCNSENVYQGKDMLKVFDCVFAIGHFHHLRTQFLKRQAQI